MKKIYISILLFGFINSLFIMPGFSYSEPRATDPGRVQITTNSYGYQVVNADGDIFRGASIWLWKAKIINNFSELAYAFEESYYQMLADSCVNSIRLAIYDPGMNSGGYMATDYSNPSDVAWFLEYVDSVVNYASKYNMNVLVNYHDVGRYRGEYGDGSATTIGYLKDFWTAVAPHYKDRTHVFYEIVNEPAFGCSNFTNELFDSVIVAYDLARSFAPETHMNLFTFTAAVGKDWDETTMWDAMQRFDTRYPDHVDWTKASVGFHPYTTDYRTSDPILNTMANYPVINTEANFPCEQSIHDQVLEADAQCQELDGEIFINQTMERLGISWFQHKTAGVNLFNNNWSLILQDARAKGYLWCNDTSYVLTTNNDGNGTVSLTPSSGTYAPNSNVQATAVNNSGYAFDHWTGDIPSGHENDNPVTITMDSDKSITAHFVPSSAVLAGSNSPVCTGDIIQLTESGGDADEWSWTGPGSFTSSIQNPQRLNAATTMSGTYYVTITDNDNGGFTAVDSVTVNVSDGDIKLVTTNPDPNCPSVDLTDPAVTAGSSGGNNTSKWYEYTQNSFIDYFNGSLVNKINGSDTVFAWKTNDWAHLTFSQSDGMLHVDKPSANKWAKIELRFDSITVDATHTPFLIMEIRASHVLQAGNFEIRVSHSLDWYGGDSCNSGQWRPAIDTNWTELKYDLTTAQKVDISRIVRLDMPFLGYDPAIQFDIRYIAIGDTTEQHELTYWEDASATMPLSNPESVTTDGTYYIKLGDGACADIEPVTVNIDCITGMSANNSATGKVIIYPNPLQKGDAYLQLTGFDIGEEIRVSIFSVLGEMIVQRNITIDSGTSTIKFTNRESLPEGLYMIQINSENGKQKNLRLIVQ